jgi:ankyrin repeat protein
MGWLKNEYANRTIGTGQMSALLDNAFTNNEINLLIEVVNDIPSLSNFIFNDVEKPTFLLRALQHAQGLPLVQAIIDKGADVNKADATGMTPLVYAVQYLRTEALKLLLAAGANVNKKTSIQSPLYHAVREGSVEAVKLLLNAGATITDQVLHIAETITDTFNKEEILKMLQEKKANPNVRFSTLQIKL